MKDPLWPAQRFTQQNFAAVVIIAAQLTTHDRGGNDAHAQTAFLGRMRNKCFKQGITAILMTSQNVMAERLRTLFDFDEIVVFLLQDGANMFNRIVQIPAITPMTGGDFQLIPYFPVGLKQTEHAPRRGWCRRNKVLQLAP